MRKQTAESSVHLRSAFLRSRIGLRWRHSPACAISLCVLKLEEADEVAEFCWLASRVFETGNFTPVGRAGVNAERCGAKDDAASDAVAALINAKVVQLQRLRCLVHVARLGI